MFIEGRISGIKFPAITPNPNLLTHSNSYKYKWRKISLISIDREMFNEILKIQLTDIYVYVKK